MAIWRIWLIRNANIFPSDLNLHDPINSIITVAGEFFALNPPKSNHNKETIWEKPPDSMLKLNSHGSAIGNPGRAGVGSIIRDHLGNSIAANCRKLGITNSLAAKLWALRDGLHLAERLNLHSKIVAQFT
ncbi:hypothetical protein COLO4_24835 [Corchorus olitorius]|uniref:RNase H type-1 domain-containing protein n=1 Tax=Corchorus olitorius TaxID=93759 RepID=A0A1R3I6B8_9ROSI|nr:hypothetical protein COLO4_24835 [Corchorus olitorius]